MRAPAAAVLAHLHYSSSLSAFSQFLTCTTTDKQEYKEVSLHKEMRLHRSAVSDIEDCRWSLVAFILV
ncbi:unnamed protein product [Urochloa humidicola]